MKAGKQVKYEEQRQSFFCFFGKRQIFNIKDYQFSHKYHWEHL